MVEGTSASSTTRGSSGTNDLEAEILIEGVAESDLLVEEDLEIDELRDSVIVIDATPAHCPQDLKQHPLAAPHIAPPSP